MHNFSTRYKIILVMNYDAWWCACMIVASNLAHLTGLLSSKALPVKYKDFNTISHLIQVPSIFWQPCYFRKWYYYNYSYWSFGFLQLKIHAIIKAVATYIAWYACMISQISEVYIYQLYVYMRMHIATSIAFMLHTQSANNIICNYEIYMVK